MLQSYSYLNVADNTGAKQLRVIQVLKPAPIDQASIGDIVVCSVKKASPQSLARAKEVVRAVIVRQRAQRRRPDGSTARFDDNAAVIINNDGSPKGSRVIGPVARELRERGFVKIISLADEVL